MNWDAIGAIGEIVGAAAVVVTLAYLTTQIRQNTRQLASTSLQGLADRAENRMLLVASNREFAQIALKFQNAAESLSELEVTQLGAWIGAWITDLEETHRQFQLSARSTKRASRCFLRARHSSSTMRSQCICTVEPDL